MSSALTTSILCRHARNQSRTVSRTTAALVNCRSASLNSAISRGLRKSQGVGFRGKEWSRDGDQDRSRSFEPRGGTDDGVMGYQRQENFTKSYSGNTRSGDRSEGRLQRFARTRDSERDENNSRFDDRRPNSRSQRDQMNSRDRGYERPQRSKYTGSEGGLSSRLDDPRSGGRKDGFEERDTRDNTDRYDRFPDRGSRSSREAEPQQQRRDFDSPAPRSFAPKRDKSIPISVPYTTPASVFLYGTSSVEAALTSTHPIRRKMYKLYIYNGENREDNKGKDQDIERLARRQHIQVEKIRNDLLPLMDKMSGGRPHNGFVLEASPLPQLPVRSLEKADTSGFTVELGHQSREEAIVNGDSNFIPTVWSPQPRNPLVLLLDGIKDEGNLGGIIRTANFLGVTAIVLTQRGCAPLSQIVIKAAAGATENMTMLTIKDVKEADFVASSRQNGWDVFAAVAPDASDRNVHNPYWRHTFGVDELNDCLQRAPCLLMLGSEGEGLRYDLKKQAKYGVVIPGSKQRGHVDSLNVSVAAGLLCHAFFKDPKAEEKGREISKRIDAEEKAAQEDRLF